VIINDEDAKQRCGLFRHPSDLWFLEKLSSIFLVW